MFSSSFILVTFSKSLCFLPKVDYNWPLDEVNGLLRPLSAHNDLIKLRAIVTSVVRQVVHCLMSPWNQGRVSQSAATLCHYHSAGNAHLNSEGGSISTVDLLVLTG